jgi:hypothetical protein
MKLKKKNENQITGTIGVVSKNLHCKWPFLVILECGSVRATNNLYTTYGIASPEYAPSIVFLRSVDLNNMRLATGWSVINTVAITENTLL